MSVAFLSLGSNIGDSKALIKKALFDIASLDKVNSLKASSLYCTKPVGYLFQDDFVNVSAVIDTSYTKEELLKLFQELEQKYKRVRLFKDGPRTLDIDILTYDDVVSDNKELILPHPRMHERAFVLIPLMEIAPEAVIAKHNLSVKELADRLPAAQIEGVKRINE